MTTNIRQLQSIFDEYQFAAEVGERPELSRGDVEAVREAARAAWSAIDSTEEMMALTGEDLTNGVDFDALDPSLRPYAEIALVDRKFAVMV